MAAEPLDDRTQPMDTSDREIVLTRLFDAPRHLVFEAWTRAEHVAQWWGPNGFTTTTKEMDVRPGGVWRFTMHGPDGTDYPNRVSYIEVVKPERLVYLHGSDDDPEQFRATIRFQEEGGKTRVTMHSLFPTAAARDYVVREFHAIEGGKQTLERLDGFLQATANAEEREVIIRRVIDAPRELVFRAWTDPKQMAQWWGPRGFTNPECDLDVRAGGKWRIVMRSPGGDEHAVGGVYIDVAEPERLVYLTEHPPEWDALIRENTGGADAGQVHNTVTFENQEGKTLLTIRTRFDSAAIRDGFVKMGMNEGWLSSLEKLEELLGRE